MPVTFDFTADEIEKELDEIISEEIAELANSVFNGCVDRTPVRSGNLRASWRIEYGGSPDMSSFVIGGTPDSPMSAPTAGKIPKGALNVYIVNCTPYADLVEDGGPKNPPHHMLALTLQSLGL